MRDRLSTLAPEQDLVVIGGGINGAGVARDAALRGLRVVLLDKNDFAAGTSSKTSKLVHGGLRYLEHGALRLVWEACRERRILLHTAPHLVRPLPFVFPLYDDSRVSPWRLRAGMWLYDMLSAFRNVHRHRMLGLRRADQWREGLRREGLRTLALYYDAWMDDARLVLANVVAAREAGAATLNYTAVTRVLTRDGKVEGVEATAQNGETLRLRAPIVVVCAGPWTNALLATLPHASRPVAATRGTHIVVRQMVNQGFTLAAGVDGRIFFVLPWHGQTLIGTTDLADDGDADAVAATAGEVDYLLAAANHYFPDAGLGHSDVIATFAGLRPLRATSGATSARPREHDVLEPAPGLFCVVGGKYTTYRAVAEEVVNRVVRRLGRRSRCRTATTALPGGAVPWGPRQHWEEGPLWQKAVADCVEKTGLPPLTVQHLWRVYGTRADRVLALAREVPHGDRPLCPHFPHITAEVLFALREEMAWSLEDWFFRRSRMAYAPCHGLDAVPLVANLYAAELAWTAQQRANAIANLQAQIEATSLTPLLRASSRS